MMMYGQETYIAETPLLLGLRWERMELNLSVAMLEEEVYDKKDEDGCDLRVKI